MTVMGLSKGMIKVRLSGEKIVPLCEVSANFEQPSMKISPFLPVYGVFHCPIPIPRPILIPIPIVCSKCSTGTDSDGDSYGQFL